MCRFKHVFCCRGSDNHNLYKGSPSFGCNILSNSSKFYLRFCGNLVGKLFKLLTPKHLGHTQLTYHTTMSDLSVQGSTQNDFQDLDSRYRCEEGFFSLCSTLLIFPDIGYSPAELSLHVCMKKMYG